MCYNRRNPGRVGQRGCPIYISDLSLVNFRNYEKLELKLGPGMVLIQGENGQGKSNLLEAMYILAIAKSPRASTDRELVRWQSAQEETYSQVSAVVRRGAERLRVQIGLRSVPVSADGNVESESHPARGTRPEAVSVQKYIRINGVPRRASDLVGVVNAVMFSADDLELVHGPPTVRRRYLDILISQLDNHYLRALQRYQRVISQRNHLLKIVREGGSHADELDFWDGELVSEGKYIMAERLRTLRRLSELAGPVHKELTGNGEALEIVYRPSVLIREDWEGGAENALARDIRRALESQRQREIAQGFTASGPHRDDLQLLIDGMDAGVYASRGQSRTVALAMKLAEAAYLMDRRNQEPILLLDDVLSELDATRRVHVLDWASRYQQCFITTADAGAIEKGARSRMDRFVVRRGRVEAVSVTANG